MRSRPRLVASARTAARMQLGGVLDAGLGPVRIVYDGRGRDVNLVGEEAQYSDRDNLSGQPAETRVAQQRRLHRRTQLIGRTVACVDPFEIIGRERLVARHLAVGDRRVEQPMPFVTGEQGSPRHGVSPRVCGGSQFTETETPNRRIGQSPDRGGGRSLSVTHCVV